MGCWLWINNVNFDHASPCCILSARQTFGQIGNRHKTHGTLPTFRAHSPAPSPGNNVNNIAICYSVYISYICPLGRFPLPKIAASRARREHNNCLLQIEKDNNKNNSKNNDCTALASLFFLATTTIGVTTTTRWQAIHHSHESVIYIILLTFRFAVISGMFFFSLFLFSFSIALHFFVAFSQFSHCFSPLHISLLFCFYSSCALWPKEGLSSSWLDWLPR